jgi:hypothetical protein
MDSHEVITRFQEFGADLANLIDDPTPLKLGEIKAQLLSAISHHKEKGEAYIQFSFGSAYPTTFDSYRGNFRDLCIQYSGEYSGSGKKAGDFLKEIESAYAEEFQGWKGGSYRMNYDSEVYVACGGRTSKTRIIGIRANDFDIEILTAQIED